jgi:DNA repair protein RecO (recombination protein O)
MNTKTEAIVLNKIKYSDSSYIVNLFTKESGRVAVFVRMPANGSKSKSTVKPSLFFSLNTIQTEISHKPTRNIQTIKYCNQLNSCVNIFSDVYKSSIAQFIAEIIVKTLKEFEPDLALYDYISSVVNKLNQQNCQTHSIHLAFMKDYAKYLGFAITDNYSELSPFFNLREGMFLPVFTTSEESLDIDDSKSLSDLLELDVLCVETYIANYRMRKRLLEKLLLYYRLHIDNFPEIKSIKVLNEVFVG